MRTCNLCKKEKPLEAFNKDCKGKKGYAVRCRECKAKRQTVQNICILQSPESSDIVPTSVPIVMEEEAALQKTDAAIVKALETAEPVNALDTMISKVLSRGHFSVSFFPNGRIAMKIHEQTERNFTGGDLVEVLKQAI